MAQTEDTLLIVENDLDMQARIVAVSEALGFNVLTATTVSAAKAHSVAHNISLVILDRCLDDDEDGLSYIRWLNALEVKKPGILVMSFLNSADDHILGLELGADDYISKPFKTEELAARIRAVSRRAKFQRSPEAVLFFANLELRYESQTVLIDGQTIKLQPKSIALLQALAERGGEWISRRALWHQVWTDFPNLPPQDTVINNAISRLRRDLAAASGPSIISEDLGYRLQHSATDNEAAAAVPSAKQQGIPRDGYVTFESLANVNRLEVIDKAGRSYVNADIEKLETALQDGAKTLKIFLS